MIDSGNGDDADRRVVGLRAALHRLERFSFPIVDDRREVELGAALQELRPWLIVYLRSYAGYRRANAQDIEDVVGATILQMIRAARNPKNPIHHPPAYVLGVARNCLSEYLQRRARQPELVDNVERFVDSDRRRPDRIAADREVFEMARPAFRRFHQLRPRMLTTLGDFDGQLHELQGIRQDLFPLFGSDYRAWERTRGHWSHIQEVGLVLEELPRKVALLTKFFQEF
jgi:DNA-directed RNA polymerase specialized sigma24 family protein